MKIVIDIPEEDYNELVRNGDKTINLGLYLDLGKAVKNGTPLPKGHGRLGDLDELEQRISNFVEHDANTTDEYTVIRQRFIVDGIRQTQALIEADKIKSENITNLCNQCSNKRCIFQSGIVRSNCDFYKAESEE